VKTVFLYVFFLIILYVSLPVNAELVALALIPFYIGWFARHIARNTEYACPQCGSELKVSILPILLSP
jgi:hypothetical protein